MNPSTVPDRWRRARRRRAAVAASVAERAVSLGDRRRLAFQPFGVALVFMATAVLVVAAIGVFA